jgi:hypothetical protein
MLTSVLNLTELVNTALGIYEIAERLGQPLNQLVQKLVDVRNICSVKRRRANAAQIMAISGDLWLGKGCGDLWQPLIECIDAQLYEFEINYVLQNK